MTADRVNALVGLPYCRDTFDCADFVVHAARELFGREVALRPGHQRGLRGMRAMRRLSAEFARPVPTPAPGDLVLMVNPAAEFHAGLYIEQANEQWVLHNNSKDGCSVMTRVREMADRGLKIEGWYRWV